MNHNLNANTANIVKNGKFNKKIMSFRTENQSKAHNENNQNELIKINSFDSQFGLNNTFRNIPHKKFDSNGHAQTNGKFVNDDYK